MVHSDHLRKTETPDLMRAQRLGKSNVRFTQNLPEVTYHSDPCRKTETSDHMRAQRLGKSNVSSVNAKIT